MIHDFKTYSIDLKINDEVTFITDPITNELKIDLPSEGELIVGKIIGLSDFGIKHNLNEYLPEDVFVKVILFEKYEVKR